MSDVYATEPGDSAAGKAKISLIMKLLLLFGTTLVSKRTRKANHDHLTARNAACVKDGNLTARLYFY